MIRMDRFREVGGYVEDFPGSEEYELWFRLAQKNKLANLDQYLFSYRWHFNQGTKQKVKKLLVNTQKIQSRWLMNPKFYRLDNVIGSRPEQSIVKYEYDAKWSQNKYIQDQKNN